MMSYYYYNQPTTIGIVFSFSWELKWPQEKLKTMLKQNFGVTNKEHYVMGFSGVVNASVCCYLCKLIKAIVFKTSARLTNLNKNAIICPYLPF